MAAPVAEPTATAPLPTSALRLLLADPLALIAVLILSILFVAAAIGPELVAEEAGKMNLRARNAPPLSLDKGWIFVLGADALGRPMLARLLVASRTTLAIAAAAVAVSMLLGLALGLAAGWSRGRLGDAIMRFADILMSFPSLLLAVVVLYVFKPHVANIVAVLAITRLPVYIRTVRAEVLELRERMFVTAAIVMGASPLRIVLRHILPLVLPTVLTVATVDFAYVMLAESALSFLGIGIQPPDVTWGLMVAQGRQYLASAWWLAFFPGLLIMISTLALNLLSGWLRLATDPLQRWRLEGAAS